MMRLRVWNIIYESHVGLEKTAFKVYPLHKISVIDIFASKGAFLELKNVDLIWRNLY